MPGHATSWMYANPNIIADCPLHGNTSVNPINNLTYTYIQSYIQDIIGAVFTPLGKDPIIHLGGDEVDAGCWNEDQNIVSYMKANNLTTQTLW